MSDERAGRNESPERIKFLFLSNNRVLVFSQDAPLNIQSKYCTQTLYSQANYKFTFIPTDTKNGKNMGAFDNDE